MKCFSLAVFLTILWAKLAQCAVKEQDGLEITMWRYTQSVDQTVSEMQMHCATFICDKHTDTTPLL